MRTQNSLTCQWVITIGHFKQQLRLKINFSKLICWSISNNSQALKSSSILFIMGTISLLAINRGFSITEVVFIHLRLFILIVVVAGSITPTILVSEVIFQATIGVATIITSTGLGNHLVLLLLQNLVQAQLNANSVMSSITLLFIALGCGTLLL